MLAKPHILLSGFADEAALNKTALEQCVALSALGMHYYSIRFTDVGNGVKNVMELTKAEQKTLQQLHALYHLQIASLGSPIGKVKLLDCDDGTKNPFIPFKKYLATEVNKACQLATTFETRLLRGFSFYHPAQTNPEDHLPQVIDQLGQIAETCDSFGLTFGLEVEANLVGSTGQMLAEIHRQINHPALLLVFDAANLSMQGFSTAEVFEQYQAMKPGLGWLHIKDYHQPHSLKKSQLEKKTKAPSQPIDEEAMAHFVPADRGDGGHEAILRDLRDYLPTLEKRLRKREVPGLFLDLEPHLMRGGQFGGSSGPDGFGIALRALCRLLDYVDIDYSLRHFDTLTTQDI